MSSTKNLSAKQLWQTAGAVVGIISAILGIYTFFFQEKNVQINYEILTNANVLDINADVSKLDITYDGNNLKKATKVCV
jgi:hypothetical protein